MLILALSLLIGCDKGPASQIAAAATNPAIAICMKPTDPDEGEIAADTVSVGQYQNSSWDEKDWKKEEGIGYCRVLEAPLADPSVFKFFTSRFSGTDIQVRLIEDGKLKIVPIKLDEDGNAHMIVTSSHANLFLAFGDEPPGTRLFPEAAKKKALAKTKAKTK